MDYSNMTVTGILNEKSKIETFRTKMYQGKIIKEQSDYIRKIKDNSTNESVIEFIEDDKNSCYQDCVYRKEQK